MKNRFETLLGICVILALLILLLFMGSSALGEKITSGKYPRYGDYVRQVYKYLPTGKFDAGE